MALISSGIRQLDKLLGGGFPESSNITFTGMPGTGKSLFIHKIIYHLLEQGYYVLFITTDRSPEVLMRETSNLDMNYKKYLDNGQLRLIDVYGTIARLEGSTLKADIRDLTSFSLLIDKALKQLEGKKVVQVYDVLSELFIWTRSKNLILRFISMVCSRTAKSDGLTFFVINEGVQKEEYLNNIKALTQGIIKLGFEDEVRYLKITKMRGAYADTDKHYFKINKKNGKISFIRNKK